jgi:pleiotropic regulator 1
MVSKMRRRGWYSYNSWSEYLLIKAPSARIRLSVKINDEYRDYKELPPSLLAQQGAVGPVRPKGHQKAITAGRTSHCSFRLLVFVSHPLATADTSRMIASIDSTPAQRQSTLTSSSTLSQALTLHKTTRTIKPTYHAPWKLARVISGHLGWVRSVAVEPGNQWFVTGAGDRVIKVWDLASGDLKLSLTGHISTVRGLAVSPRHPYLFSCGEDKVA